MKGDTEIYNTMDIIDSRDIIDRIEYLESEKEQFEGTAYEKDSGSFGFTGSNEDFTTIEEARESEWSESEEGEELKNLLSLQEEGEGYSHDWEYGSTLIRDSYFTDYAQQLAEDIGAVSREDSWPKNCIDWDFAAEQLKQDYTSIDFNGIEYWIR